jgi:hypothetical protein
MALTRGRVENVIHIIGKDSASDEIDKAIKRLQALQNEGEETGKGFKEFAKKAAIAGAAVAGAAVAAKALFDTAKEGAAFADQLDVLNAKTGGFGRALEEASEAAGGLINKKALVEGAQTFSNFGISLENFSGVAEQVAKTAVATGESTEHLMSSIARGVARSSPAILDNLGIQVSLTEANEAYAKSLGKTADSLTDAEKKAALMAEVLRKLEVNNKNVNIEISRTAALKKLETAYDDATTAIQVHAADTLALIVNGAPGVERAIFGMADAMELFGNQAEAAADKVEKSMKTAQAAVAAAQIEMAKAEAQAAAEFEAALLAEEEEKQRVALNEARAGEKKRRGGKRLSKEDRALRKRFGSKGFKFLKDFEEQAKARAEAERRSLEVAEQFREERRAKEQAAIDETLEMERLAADERVEIERMMNEAREKDREAAEKRRLDGLKKEEAAMEAFYKSAPGLVRQAAELIGVEKREMAILDGLIASADSIQAFVKQDYAAGAGYALAAAAYFKAAAFGKGGSSGAKSSGASQGRGRFSRAINSTRDTQQGGGTTVINFAGFAVGSPQQLGSQLSGALGSVRGTGQERAGRV